MPEQLRIFLDNNAKNMIIQSGIVIDEKIKRLIQVKVDSVNWVTYYLDEETGEKWIREFPFPEMQAGGPPQLRSIEKFPWE